MNARLVLERTIDILPRDIEDDLLVTAGCSFGKRRNGIFETLDLEIFGVHAEKVSGEDSRLVSSCTAANLHDHILAVLRILRQQLQFEFLFQFGYLRLQFLYLRFRHLLHLGVGLIVEQVLGVLQVVDGFLVAGSHLEHPFQVVVLTVEPHITGLVGYHRRVRDKQTHFMELGLKTVYFIENVHGSRWSLVVSRWHRPAAHFAGGWR